MYISFLFHELILGTGSGSNIEYLNIACDNKLSKII
jgi:hypothetical protein